MPSLEVTDNSVAGVLEKLRKGEWLIPHFQRDFVWSTDQVSSLVQSIVEARPIGMVTLWEQADAANLELEIVSIPDHDSQTNASYMRPFSQPAEQPKRRYAVLDGRQRCTAIAMAFGGFRAMHGAYKYSGRYFLDVKEEDPKNRIRYLRESEVKAKHLHIDSSCVSQGLFPLSSNKDSTEEIFPQWARYLQSIHNPANYPNGELPGEEELKKRNKILQDAFQGISETRLAVYIVSEKYSLSDICDIFETLNTTGTKVSTVDLIHSWLYADTVQDPNGSFLLREWINDLGQKDGAIGWSSASDRPELIAQVVTACYAALETKPPPRPVGKGKPQPILSIKSGDLLATPVEHWKAVRANDDLLAAHLGDGQRAVAGGFFPWRSCPYPAVMTVYVALRWHSKFDDAGPHPWSRDELDALYKAFFWRTALTRRYDQGFLTQVGSDIARLKSWLRTRIDFESSSQWAAAVEAQLSQYITFPLPSEAELVDLLTDGDPGGALGKALALPMLAGVRKDLVNTGTSLEYPSTEPVELHHIYPKEWCRNNKSGALAKLLDANLAGRDYVNSISNLMPLSRVSNNNWRQKIPGQFIVEKQLSFPNVKEVLRPLFIDEAAFQSLADGDKKIEEFWLHRASLIAQDILERTKVIL
jgi:hypothetical protein